MLSEKQIRHLYDNARAVLYRCQDEVTIDAAETDAAATEKILATVLHVPSHGYRKKKE